MKQSCITIGTFDGVHLGHRKLINKLISVSKARHLKSVLVAFDAPVKNVTGVLTTTKEKIELLSRFPIDELVILENKSDIIRESRESFLNNFLHKKYNARHLVAGANFAFGKNRHGTIEWLKKHGALKGIEIDVVPPLKIKGKVVSSSLIRELIEKGDIKAAGRFLGRNYSLTGSIVKGRGLGTKMGFSTLNLDVEKGKMIPRGIFISLLKSADAVYPSITFIGSRATIENDGKVFPEVHILNYKDKWETKIVSVELIKKIRQEKKFSSLEKLISQIAKDVAVAEKFFVT